MLNLFCDDIISNFYVYEKALSFLGGDVPDDDDVWEIAKQSDSAPHIGNIYQELVFSRIADIIGLDRVVYFVNALDSKIYIDGQECYGLDDFLEVFAKAA